MFEYWQNELLNVATFFFFFLKQYFTELRNAEIDNVS